MSDKKDDKDKEKTIEINGKSYTAKDILGGIKDLNAAKGKAEANLKAVSDELLGLKNAKPADKGDGNKKTVTDDDLEGMSRSEFMSHMLESVGKTIVDPINVKLAKGEQATAANATKAEIKAVEDTYGDFWEFEDEVKNVLKANPSINIEDAYLLAKGKSPDKVATLETAAKKEAAKEKKEEDPKKFGGLLPTSGLTRENSKMGLKDAAESAWESNSVGEHLRSVTSQ